MTAEVSGSSAAALESTPSGPFWSVEPWCSRKTSVLIRASFPSRKSRIFCAPDPSSSILIVSPRDGGSPRAMTVVREPASPARSASSAQVGERLRVLRLLLGAHDPLERRVPRLVDGVRHREHRGQGGADAVVAELGLALGGGRPARDLQLRDLGDDRHPQAVGHRRPQHRAVGVGRLLTEEHQVRRLGLQRRREDVAGGHQVRPGRRLVRHQQRPVGAHGETLAHRLQRAARAHRDEHHLALTGGVPQPERLLDGVEVEGVERAVAGAIHPQRPGVDPSGRTGVRNLLDADRDLHPCPLPKRVPYEVPNPISP